MDLQNQYNAFLISQIYKISHESDYGLFSSTLCLILIRWQDWLWISDMHHLWTHFIAYWDHIWQALGHIKNMVVHVL